MQSSFTASSSTRTSNKPKRKPRVDDLAPPKFEDDYDDGQMMDFSYLHMKEDPQNYPIWVCPNLRIFIEAFSPLYKEASSALTTIAEPVSRPELIHEYQLTPYSLYAAVSVRIERKMILEILLKFAKNRDLPPEVVGFVNECTRRYGKAKIVLKNNRYFIECSEQKYADQLLMIPSVAQANASAVKKESLYEKGIRINPSPDYHPEGQDEQEEMKKKEEEVQQNKRIKKMNEMEERRNRLKEEFDVFFEVEEIEDPEDQEEKSKSVQFELSVDSDIEGIKRDCIQARFPLLQEYDFKRDHVNPQLEAELKDTTNIRPYQELALSKIFSSSRARSGIIVLPCGAGKTLVGISVACTIKKRTIVLCTSSVAVEQWKEQFDLWSTIDPKKVVRFTSTNKDPLFSEDEAGVVVSTYSMLGFTGTRGKESEQFMSYMKKLEWGLLILDEVQVVPAEVFRTVIHSTNSHCKLGLTATLVREDKKIQDLNFLIGPKLYEANWLELQADGYLARVKCVEVWCDMTPQFFQEYLNSRGFMKRLLYVNNPNKFLTCQYLIQYHESRGDKIIVFSDNLIALKNYAQKLERPAIYGAVSQTERIHFLRLFKRDPSLNTLFISSVGDTSIDLPSANVIIQISSHFGSRRQEAQRLGRILRPKQAAHIAKKDKEYNAFFYSLVSRDTHEMLYADKRQQFLIDQGYSFEVIKDPDFLKKEEIRSKLKMSKYREQITFLEKVLQTDQKSMTEHDVVIDPDDIERPRAAQQSSALAYQETKLSLGQLVGDDGAAYREMYKR